MVCDIHPSAHRAQFSEEHFFWETVNCDGQLFQAPINPSTAERRTKVLITTYSQKRLELTVIQKGQTTAPSDHDPIEDVHDVVTDQPAYAPIRS